MCTRKPDLDALVDWTVKEPTLRFAVCVIFWLLASRKARSEGSKSIMSGLVNLAIPKAW
jgi:hypothetical protein